MKKLEELGISPAPWELDDQHDGYISDKIGYAVASADGDCTRNMIANARLIAATPDMYEAGHAVILDKCKRCVWCNRDPENKCEFTGKCSVKNLRAALAKASGESEASNG